jgi:hypothetical protein
MVDSKEEEKKSSNNEGKNEAIMTSTEAIKRKSAPIKWMDSLPSNHVIPLPVRTIGGIRDQTLKRKQCTCKKSSCLKLYCDCFNSGIFCNVTTCKCLECKNQEFKGQFDKDFRTEAILAVLDRNELKISNHLRQVWRLKGSFLHMLLLLLLQLLLLPRRSKVPTPYYH